MTTLGSILLTVLTLTGFSLLAIWLLARRAPLGWEDGGGFHLGRNPAEQEEPEPKGQA